MQPDDGSVKLVGNHELSDNRETLYRTAVRQRGLGRIGAALAILERIEFRFPDYSRLHEERAYCFLAMCDTPRAIESFERAVSINAALLSSWRELERLHRANGDMQKAASAAQHLGVLERLPPPLVEAGSSFCDGEMATAKRVLKDFLDDNGGHVEALRLLGRIAHHSNHLEEAGSLFEQVLTVAPDYRAARADYVRTLIEQRRYTEAQQQLDTLLKLEPGNCDYLSLSATIYAGLGQHECAITIYRQVLVAAPGWAHLYLLLGNSLKAVGRQPEAIDSYRAAAISRPGFGDAYWSLANLKTYCFSADEIGQMRCAQAAPATQVVDRYHLCFALGKALEDRAEYEESWRYYERGNALKIAHSPYDPHSIESEIDSQIEACTADFFATRAGFGYGTPEHTPIFIVGLPRSGSTLIEQILASHSKIEGTQELPTVSRIVQELNGHASNSRNQRYPAALATLDRRDFHRLGERYLRETRAYIQGKPSFIDKMPNNFRHIGLIHLMLPTAKIIDVRRDPMACCCSNLQQLYARGQEFTYSIDSIARYYNSYLRLMNHWDEALPTRILRISYEDVVDDLQTNVLRLLDFCGLQMEPRCLRFYDTGRSINTASSQQVRQPIFRTGLTKWRHFEPWLGPLKEALACGPPQ